MQNNPLVDLPIDSQIPEILQMLATKNNLILQASPGAGKTTRLPPALAQRMKGKILVLEPRRIAAISAADRIAQENGWTLGQEVGYQVRFDRHFHGETKLIFLTEALLARWIQQNRNLEGIDCVVLDEFHERSIHTDLAIGLLKELQTLERPDLKIVVMSATLNPEPIARFLGESNSISVPGRAFQLDLIYRKDAQLLQTQSSFFERCHSTLRTVVGSSGATALKHNDVLMFLPGVGEINRLLTILREDSLFGDFSVLPLHGQMNLEDQRAALQRQRQRKIILATNVAESALTIDGVGIVVDSGLSRILRFHQQTGIARLEITRISKSSATQRAGRAARQSDGWCYKMWSKTDELSMPDFDVPELHRSDLCDSLLLLAELGIRDFSNFAWFEKPEQPKLLRAAETLLQLGALDSQCQLTSLGKEIMRFPLSAVLAKLIVVGQQLGIPSLACDSAALLSERDPYSHHSFAPGSESDLMDRLELIEKDRKNRKHTHLLRTAEQLRKLIRQSPPTGETPLVLAQQKLDQLLLEVFTHRLCRLRSAAGSERGQMVGGKGVRLGKNSNVRNSVYFAALALTDLDSSSESQVFLAHGFDEQRAKAFMSKEAVETSTIEFNPQKERLIKVLNVEFRGLKIETPRESPLSPEEIEQNLPSVAKAQWVQLLASNAELNAWISRLAYFEWRKELRVVTDDFIIRALKAGAYGEKTFAALILKDLCYFFNSELPTEVQKDFSRSCPEALTVPSGSKIRIHYEQGKNPFLEVRIQEIFGMQKTPTVFEGQLPVTLHLLGPNYRPVQVTEDLHSFWQNGYQEIRKELRIRYPKHSWPENPLNAKPEAKGRPRKF